jgi:hypothetical protein
VVDIPLPDVLRNFEWDNTLSISSVNSLELHLLGDCTDCNAAQN